MGIGIGTLFNPNRRIIRAPVNPLDKSTVVSIFPKLIDEVKHTIQPGRFIIQAGSLETPALLVVGPSSWWREIDEDQPLLEIPHSSVQIADSIVRDYCVGLLGYSVNEAGPGMFYVPGEHSVKQIKEKYSKELENALARQRNWYTIQIKLADALWSRSNGNPIAISDDMRMAAREMGAVNRDWMQDFKMVDMIKCFACGGLRNPEYPICPHCKVLDTSHPQAKNLTFAK